MKNAILAPTALIGAALVVPSPAAAQAAPAPDHRWEVAILVGVSLRSVEDDFGLPVSIDAVQTLEAFFPPGRVGLPISLDLRQRRRLGGGFLQGFQLGRRLARRGWLEAGFLIAPQTVRREVSFRCPAEVCALTSVSNLLVDALEDEQRATAYHYGVGFAYELSGGDVRPFLSAGLGAVTYDLPAEGATDFAFEVGAGARLASGDRLGARIEVRDRIVPDHFFSGDTEHDLQVRAGAVFRLP